MGAVISARNKEVEESPSWKSIREHIRACMQCGTCTGSCGSSAAMDYTPRQLWRMVQLGLLDEIFASRTFSLCSSCYYCTLRCPRGLHLTEAMHALKRLAAARGFTAKEKGTRFYLSFLKTARRYGRIREMELMTRYFLVMKDPLLPFGFAPLGVKLLRKGKISPQMPRLSGPDKLDAIFRKVKELEAGL
jgi:heterodisulfide reductase subunit C